MLYLGLRRWRCGGSRRCGRSGCWSCFLGGRLRCIGCSPWLDGSSCGGYVAHIDCDEHLRRLGGGAVTAELEHPEQEEEEGVASHSHQDGEGTTARSCGIGLWHRVYRADAGSLSARVAKTTLRED